MAHETVCFSFDASVPMAEGEATLRLALLAVECLHGEDRVHLEARATIDRAARTCIIDLTAEVGRTLALVFGGYVRREFGRDAVDLVRVPVSGARALAGTGA